MGFRVELEVVAHRKISAAVRNHTPVIQLIAIHGTELN